MTIVRIKGIKVYRSHGRTYAYHRATGERIDAPIGSDGFFAQLKILNERVAPRPPKGAPARGSFGALKAAYLLSPEHKGLAASTRADYRDVLDWLDRISDMMADRFDPPFVMDLRDRAFKARKRRFANYVVQVISLVFNWGKLRHLCKGNPAADVPKIRRPRGAPVVNRSWTTAEIAAVVGAADGGIKVALALGAMTGMREGDVLRLTWSCFDGSAIEWRQGKTGDKVWQPCDPALGAFLATWRAAQAERARRRAAIGAERGRPAPIASTQIVTGRSGRPFTESGFRSSLFKLIGSLEEAGKIGPGLTFHGLRHTMGKAVAEVAGDDTRSIAAVLGHRTEAQASHYAAEENRRRRTTRVMRKMERLRPKIV